MRDARLADDRTGTAEVILDAIERLDAAAMPFVCYLYPTAPFVRPDDLKVSYRHLRQAGADSLVATTEFDFPPLRALLLEEDGRLAFQWAEHTLSRSQDLPRLVHDAGAFYWLRTAAFLKARRIVADNAVAWPMERLRAVDIDTEEDLRFAEALMRFHREHGGDGDA